MHFGPIENEQKSDIFQYFNLDPWALDPPYPPILSLNSLILQPPCLEDI